jgi:hypothetical protein
VKTTTTMGLLASMLLAVACGKGKPGAEADDATLASDARKRHGDKACAKEAEEMVPKWRRRGLSPKQVEEAFEVEYRTCTGELDASAAKLLGAVNVDLFRLAKQVTDGSLSTTDYLTVLRDRRAKLFRAHTDTAYAQATAAADADGDFVPDSLDQCPNTPDLTPTDPAGCPQQPNPNQPPPPQGPDLQLVLALLRGTNVLADKNCEGAPVPDVPQPVKIGYGDGRANVALTRVTNQPAKCSVLYEVDLRFMNDDWESLSLLGPKYPHMLFKASEEMPGGMPAGVAHFGFTALDTADLGNRKIVASFLGQYQHVDWRVRAINGSGLKSVWSETQRTAGPLTGDATLPFTVP